MSDFLPAGRLAKITESGVVIQVQTEFSWHPVPRVATTVCLDGVVLHKIQKDWEAPIETVPQQRAVEKFINSQHDEIVSLIESQKQQLVGRQKRKDAATILQELVSVRGINAAWCLTNNGIISPDSGGRELLPEYKGIFEGLHSLCSFLSSISTLGDMVGGEIVLEEDSLLIFRRNSKYYIVGFDAEHNSAELMSSVREIVEQV